MVKKQVKKRISKTKIVFSVIAILLFIFGYFLGKMITQERSIMQDAEEKEILAVYEPLKLTKDASISSILIPAVDKEGNSVVTKVNVAVVPGYGRTLVDIDSLFYWVDTQNSIRMAKAVSANITGMDLSKYDLIYDVDAKASLIGGPSAGAAITLATISALEKKPLNTDVMITGSINHDGSIGPVGEITSKAQAAKDAGATMFLVPLLQSNEITYETRKHCEKFGLAEFCSVEQIPVKTNVADQVTIEVKEVSDIREAFSYFYGDKVSASP